MSTGSLNRFFTQASGSIAAGPNMQKEKGRGVPLSLTVTPLTFSPCLAYKTPSAVAQVAPLRSLGNIFKERWQLVLIRVPAGVICLNFQVVVFELFYSESKRRRP